LRSTTDWSSNPYQRWPSTPDKIPGVQRSGDDGKVVGPRLESKGLNRYDESLCALVIRSQEAFCRPLSRVSFIEIM